MSNALLDQIEKFRIIQIMADKIEKITVNPNDIIVIKYTPEAIGILSEQPDWLQNLSNSIYNSTGKQHVILVLPDNEMNIKTKTIDQLEKLVHTLKNTKEEGK